MILTSYSKPLALLLLAAAPGALLSGCAATLEPAASAARSPDGGAVGQAGGVSVVTMTPYFPGIVSIEGAVTPVKVNITNTGNSTVLIRYSDFQLVGEDGAVYPALPLYKIDTSVSAPISTLYSPIDRPDFFYRGFRLAPYYSGIYPGIPTWGGPFRYGRLGWGGYDSGFWDAFTQVQLPTPEMYRNVLPEGVLDPGGSLEGWLYFKHVTPRSGTRLDFDAKLMSVQGTELGTVSIPYTFSS